MSTTAMVTNTDFCDRYTNLNHQYFGMNKSQTQLYTLLFTV